MEIWKGGHPHNYDVHTKWRRGQAQVDACGRGRGQLHVVVHIKEIIAYTNVILSSFHAKKLAFFKPEFRFGRKKKWKFFVDINY